MCLVFAWPGLIKRVHWVSSADTCHSAQGRTWHRQIVVSGTISVSQIDNSPLSEVAHCGILNLSSQRTETRLVCLASVQRRCAKCLRLVSLPFTFHGLQRGQTSDVTCVPSKNRTCIFVFLFFCKIMCINMHGYAVHAHMTPLLHSHNLRLLGPLCCC